MLAKRGKCGSKAPYYCQKRIEKSFSAFYGLILNKTPVRKWTDHSLVLCVGYQSDISIDQAEELS